MRNVILNIKRITIIAIVFFLSIVFVRSVALDESAHVFENDSLVYYINVYYDGKDVYGVESGNNSVSDVNSGYINVEDKLPEGLIFDEFVTNNTNGIGAVSRVDGTSCPGYVVDGVNGLVYDETTHTVKFTVRNLQAGCMLTVGIKTKTPILPDGVNRMDFYNTATATEGLMVKTSNTVHAWIGKESTENAEKYNVTYVYEGEVPSSVTALPAVRQYIEGSVVGIAGAAIAPGYTFSGWELQSGNVTIDNGKFSMPNSNVVFVGRFTKDESFVPYKVTYRITSTDNPDGYILPKEKEYYVNETVNIDKLKPGAVYNDYRFSGWQPENNSVVVEDDAFSMPAQDVVLVGSWELVTYKVEYQFMGAIIPPNSETLLPETEYYRPGDSVQLQDINDVGEYEFLGWYHASSFTMPSQDVIIYGEWQYKPKYFRPTITKEIIDKQEYFSFGDVVQYKIAVTAPSDLNLKDIYVQENNAKAKFIANSGYTLVSDTVVKIDSLAAGETAYVYAEYVVSPEDNGTVVNEAEIIGAIATDLSSVIDRSVEYKASDTFNIDSTLEICNIVNNDPNNKTFDYHITGNSYDLWLSLKDGECKKVFLEPGEYNVLEVVPQDYNLISVVGNANKNNDTLNVGLGKEYGILFTNNYNQKGFFHTFGNIKMTINSFCYSSNHVNGGGQQ